MPTFTAIALDRLLEPGASQTVRKSSPTPMPMQNLKKLQRRSSEPTPTPKKKIPPRPRPQLKPALYATPEVAPLLDSPSSFPPSPYIINHKRRGPRLLKSFSEANVQTTQKVHTDEDINGNIPETEVASLSDDLQFTFTNSGPVEEKQVNGLHDAKLSSGNGYDLQHGHEKIGSSCIIDGLQMEKGVALDSERVAEGEDFYDDPRESMSLASYTDVEHISNTERTAKFETPGGEFYDAWEELSADSGTHSSVRDVEAELREIRLSLLMEIEKRKQAEEYLHNIRNQWMKLREALSIAGIVLPSDLTDVADGGQLSSHPLQDICQQLYISRFILNTIGRATARAEAEAEMEAQVESKNFEIARLMERLHYYETMNREMSQRNQEAVELARRERQRRTRRQRWIWSSVTTAIVLATTAIAWSYIPICKGSTSANCDLVPKHDDAAN